MVFDSVMNAANNQPGVKMARGLNAAANNPALNKKVALGALALGATGAAGPVGAAVGSGVANRALGAALQKGGNKRRRRRRK